MSSWSSRASVRRVLRHPSLTVAALLALAACASPDAPTGVEDEFAASYSGGYPELKVKVVDVHGQKVPGATVRIYTIEGPVGTQNTNAYGLAKFNLPKGHYCVSVRVAPEGWTSLNIVTPPSLLDYTPIGALYGPVVSVESQYETYSENYGSVDWVVFSDDNFRSCYEEPPVYLGRYGSFHVAELGEPYVVSPEVKGLNGETLTGIDVYSVIPVTVPWVTPSNPEIKTAFFSLVGRTSSPVDMVVSQGQPFAIEFQQPFGGFNITGTFKNTAGGPSGENLEIEAAPLMCQQSTADYPAGAKGIDFLYSAWGYHATLALTPEPTTAAVQIKHAGNGAVSASFRTDLPNGRLTTQIDFACANGSCGDAVVKTPGKNGQTVQVFHMDKGAGVIKTTIVLSDIPTNHTLLTFSAKASGDKIPLSSRDDDTSAFIVFPRPSVCSVQQSNDDKWVVGDI